LLTRLKTHKLRCYNKTYLLLFQLSFGIFLQGSVPQLSALGSVHL
jgi:hypothetical protein